MVSPISSASSFHNNQIPFSLQSPQNILNGENLNSGRERRESKEGKERYFGAVNVKNGGEESEKTEKDTA